MNLNDYLRGKLTSHFYKLVKKDSCEICGSTENLHVHHIYPFKDMVEDTLNELSLEYKDTDEYSEVELRNIVEKLLGKHLYYKYQTLCPNCHIQGIHRKHGKMDFSMDEDLLDKWVNKEDIVEKVIVKNDMRDKQYRLIGIPTLEKRIEEYGYKLESKRKTINRKKVTVYMITKVE